MITCEVEMSDEVIVSNASQLVTMRGPKRVRSKGEMSDLSIVLDGAVCFSDGVIIDAGKTEAIVRGHRATGVEIVDAGGKLVMPGFVDPHTHLVFAGSREFELDLKLKGKTYIDILSMGGGILRTVRDTRSATGEELFDQSARRLRSMIAHGSTTIEVKSGYGLDMDTELRILRTIARLGETYPADVLATYMGAHAVPPEFEGRADDYISFVVERVLPEVVNDGLARFCDVFCEKGVFTVPQCRRVLEAGREAGLVPKVHADEFVTSGGAELAAEVGAISAEHLAKPSDDGIMAMARKDVIAVMLPGTPFTSMDGIYPDARRLIDLGVPIALGTDLNPNCWNTSMQFTISLACHTMAMTPAEALTASTVNAAAAIGMEKRIGTLEHGKRADILILDVPSYEHIPYRMGANLCQSVFKDGVKVWEQKDLPGA